MAEKVSYRLLPKDESDSTIKLIEKMKLLLSYGSTNPLERVKHAQKILSFLENIMRSHVTAEVFFYLLEHGATTAWVLQVDLQMSESSAYRALKRLRKSDIVFKATNIRHQHDIRGGPRPIVWALQGTPPEIVAKAIIQHQRALSPKYRVAEKFVQEVLTPHLNKDQYSKGITFRQIIRYSRGHTDPFRNRDISEIAATILITKNIKVWR